MSNIYTYMYVLESAGFVLNKNTFLIEMHLISLQQHTRLKNSYLTFYRYHCFTFNIYSVRITRGGQKPSSSSCFVN